MDSRLRFHVSLPIEGSHRFSLTSVSFEFHAEEEPRQRKTFEIFWEEYFWITAR